MQIAVSETRLKARFFCARGLFLDELITLTSIAISYLHEKIGDEGPEHGFQ